MAFALEIFQNVNENYPKPLTNLWGKDVVSSPLAWFKKAQEFALENSVEYICVAFNINENEAEIPGAVDLLNEIQAVSKLPLVIKGTGQKDFDRILLPALIKEIKKPAIVAFAQDLNFEPIVKAINANPLKDSIRLILRAPIDINLSKELNILATDAGLNPENIIMDPDTGCVGMGLDYGYSIIERIKQAAADDEVLRHPIIVFSGEESFKSKESKSDDFKDSRGSLEVRSYSIELSTTMALFAAGADIAVVQNPRTISAVNSLGGLK